MIEVAFPGGARVDVTFGEFTICTDQPARSGGEGRAPSPFDLFLASLAACAGHYAKSFCEERDISTEGLGVTLDWERGGKPGRLSKIRIGVALPRGFPAKYREAIRRSVDQCAVKRHIIEPPEFELAISETESLPETLPDSVLRSPGTSATTNSL